MHLKRVASTFLRIILFPMVVVGVIFLGAWCINYFIPIYLSNAHTYGNTTVTPYGYHYTSILDHHWDSLKVENPNFTVFTKDLNINATLLDSSTRGVALGMGDMETAINLPPEDTTHKKGSLDSLKFPEKAKFYIPVKLRIDNGKVALSNGNSWKFKNLKVESEGKKKAYIAADNVEGSQIPHSTSTKVHLDFDGNLVKVDGTFKAIQDSVQLKVCVPKDNMTSATTKVDADVKDISPWLPFPWPENAPKITGTHVKVEAKAALKTKTVEYNGVVTTHMSEVYPLLAMDATIEFDGSTENLHVNTKFDNREGGTIELDGDMDQKGNVVFYGNVKHMNGKFGPQIMPLDLTIHSAEYRNKNIHALVETGNGSNFDANINFENEFSITYVADLSPYEPWAIDWSKGRLEFAKPTRVYGSFKDKHMHALVKFDTIPYAYHMTADSMYTTLDLYKDSIVFTDGVIFTPNETFDFIGDVVWDKKSDPHTSWRITQRNGGVGEAYISIIDSTTIQSKADNVVLTTIPFANFKFNEKLNGIVTGYYNENFDTRVGELDVSVDGEYQPFKLQTSVRARQNGDSVFIDRVEALHNQNKVEAELAFVLPNDSNPEFNPTGNLPIEVIHAWTSAHEFSIPLLLEPLNDTTFTSGFLTGDLVYDQKLGLMGSVDFKDLEFRNIPPQLFNIRKMNLLAEKDKLELNAYLGIGGGGWTGNTQIIVDNLFSNKRHVSVSHSSDNGGNLWAEGFIDSSLVFNGNLKANGSWFIPGSISEARRVDLQIDATAKLREGLKGITADIRMDSTLYKPPKLNYQFPIMMRGHLENSILDVTHVETKNDSGETVSGKLQFDLDSLRLKEISFHSDHYTIRTARHTVIAENIDGTLENTEENVIINASIPSIQYKFHDDALGDANALGKSKFSLEIPHNKDGIIQNKTIRGDLVVDKFVYTKELDIEVTPSSINKFITMFNNAILNLRKKESQQETKISTASPINLSVHVTESQSDSMEIITPFATFPFTFDLWVLGTTNRPLLRGDMGNSNNGFIGIKDLYEFDLNSFHIGWNNVPWQHGVVEVSSQQELPYCNAEEDEEKETCPINLDIQGTITNPQPTPSSNCGTESSSAAIYYNIFLGCVANDFNEATDWNKIAGKAIGKVLSSTANRTLGGEYIGDIDMKVMLFNNTTTSEKDSSYFKVPVSLDRWVKDLSLIFGYTQDQSENPTYDQALEFGVNYTLPFFKEKEYSHKNHINPALSLNGLLISKQYLDNTGTESSEPRVEKNIGINYVYRYWNPCLLSIGNCETYDANEKSNEKPNSEKQVEGK